MRVSGTDFFELRSHCGRDARGPRKLLELLNQPPQLSLTDRRIKNSVRKNGGHASGY
jgi:hypothetical protein